MRFGLNYIPSKRWLNSWIDWNENEIREDLIAIKSLGFDHIRAHLIWSYFQLNASAMSEHCMRNLISFVRLCEDTGLAFCLSLFTGWMSGFNFIPAWVNASLPGMAKGIFTDRNIISAEKYYIKNIAAAVAASPAFLGFDLGNELSVICGIDPHAGITERDNWHREMLNECEINAPGKLHNSGLDHNPWMTRNTFSRDVIANTGALTAIHCWTYFTGAINRDGGVTGTSSVYLPVYMAELSKAYSIDTGRKIWIQEFGNSDLWLKGGQTTETYLEKTLSAIADTENIWGVTWWCSHDLSRTLSGYDPLEYDLGILDINNKPKKYAVAFTKFINEYKKAERKPVHKKAAMILDPNSCDMDTWKNPERFMNIVKSGTVPAIILPEYKDDKDYLLNRGITDIIPEYDS